LRILDARVGVRLVRGVDDHVRRRLVPVLAEAAAADPDHRHLVAQRVLPQAEPSRAGSAGSGVAFQ
jgi:hypothetical protein